MKERSSIEKAAKILTGEKRLRLRAGAHPDGAALFDESEAVVWSGARSQIVAEVRRRTAEALSAWAAKEAETMPDLPSY